MKKWLERLLIAALFVMAAAYSFHTLSDPDELIHLKAGEWIVENGRLPATSLFSFPTEDRPWSDIYWLFQVFVSLLFRAGGIDGLIIAKTLIVLAAFFLLFTVRDRGGDRLIHVFSLMLAVLVSNERFVMRPEIMSLLFLAVCFALLHAYRLSGSRLIFLYPVVVLAWANMHGLYLIGLALLGAALTGDLAAGLLRRLLPGVPLIDRGQVLSGRRLFVAAGVLALSVGASLITPAARLSLGSAFDYQLGLYRGLDTLKNLRIPELIPPLEEDFLFPTQVVMYYKILIGMSAVSFLLNLRRLNPAYLFVYLGFLFVSLKARRNISYFAFVAAPIMSMNLAAGLSMVRESRAAVLFGKYGTKAWALMSLGLLLTAVFFVQDVATDSFYERDRSNKRFGSGVSEITFPVKAVDFVEKNGIRGNVFNDTSVGNYIIWRLYPRQKAFMDGRMEFADEGYLAYSLDPGFWDVISQRYAINYALLGHGWGPNVRPLLAALWERADWVPVYYDDIAVIFLRKTPENEQVVNAFGIPGEAIGRRRPEISLARGRLPVALYHLGNFYRVLGRTDLAEVEYRRCLDVYPDYLEVRLALAGIFLERGLPRNAAQEFGEALRIRPGLAEAHAGLADIAVREGRSGEAVRHYQEAVRQKPRFLSARYNLGLLYLQLQRPRDALDQFEAILRVDPSNAMARSIVSQYRDQGSR